MVTRKKCKRLREEVEGEVHEKGRLNKEGPRRGK